MRRVHRGGSVRARMIYLDNNATTAVDPSVLEEMLPWLGERYGNASSPYLFSKPARRAVERAREQVAALIGAEPDEILFTSGGTEADNTALLSAARVFPDRRHLIVGATEHHAVLDCAEWLADTAGWGVTRLAVDGEGRINPEELAAVIRPGQTAAAAVMAANNETGVLAPVEKLAGICAARGVFFHTDAVQAVGKTGISVKSSAIHTLALSAHKIHGPKGTGALRVSRGAPFRPMMLGGAQESGRRGGTENVAGIVGFGAAAELAARTLEAGGTEAIRAVRDRFEAEALRLLPGARINGAAAERVSNTTSITIPGVQAEGLIFLLDQRGICVSAGSACTTGSRAPSHVLTAMGIDADDARATLRVSFSRHNTMAEADTAASAVAAAVAKFRSVMSPSVSGG